MPLNGAGVFSPPAGTTATSNTTILSAAYNALVADLTSTLNTAAKFQDASVTAPNGFAADSNTGFYRIGADNLGIALGGVKHADFATTGVALLEKAAPTSSGTNTVTLTWPIVASALASEQRIVFKAGGSNTSTAVTLNLNGLGAKAVKKFDGGAESVLLPRDIEAGQIYLAVYDSTLASGSGAWVLVNPSQQGRYPPGTLYGLTLSYSGGGFSFDVSVGSARDSSDAGNIDLPTAYTKVFSAWTVGNGQGCLDTGAIANNTYHVFVIKRPDTGVVDVLISLSPTAPTMPTNYTLFRRIGSLLREAGVLVAFSQNGDEFLRVTPVADINATNPGTSAVPRTLSVPVGVVVDAMILAGGQNSGTAAFYAYFSALSQTDQTPNAINGLTDTVAIANVSGSNIRQGVRMRVRTNTSAQIRSRLDASDANSILRIVTLGWVDTRGRV